MPRLYRKKGPGIALTGELLPHAHTTGVAELRDVHASIIAAMISISIKAVSKIAGRVGETENAEIQYRSRLCSLCLLL
jgi:hypothetical protein